MEQLTKEQKLLREVVQKAWEDATFKEELIANPVAAVEKLTGEKLQVPEGKTLVVRDQTEESALYINVPAEQEMDDVELSEEQLEVVAGGIIGPGGCIPNPFDGILPGTFVPKPELL